MKINRKKKLFLFVPIIIMSLCLPTAGTALESESIPIQDCKQANQVCQQLIEEGKIRPGGCDNIEAQCEESQKDTVIISASDVQVCRERGKECEAGLAKRGSASIDDHNECDKQVEDCMEKANVHN